MSTNNRNPNRCRSDPDRIIPHDLFCFIHHFHFFLGIAVVEEDIYLRQHIPVDLVRIERLGKITDGFKFQLPLRFCSAAGN